MCQLNTAEQHRLYEYLRRQGIGSTEARTCLAALLVHRDFEECRTAEQARLAIRDRRMEGHHSISYADAIDRYGRDVAQVAILLSLDGPRR